MRHLGRILVGFLAAALAGSIVLHLFLAAMMAADGETATLLSANTIWTILFGMVAICLNAALPALVVILLAERLAWRRWWIFTLAGALPGIVTALGIYLWRAVLDGDMPPTLLIWILLAGMVSGFTYWSIAGRHSGAVRRPMV